MTGFNQKYKIILEQIAELEIPDRTSKMTDLDYEDISKEYVRAIDLAKGIMEGIHEPLPWQEEYFTDFISRRGINITSYAEAKE